MGYYQRQILERLEHISGEGRARNPLKQENKSSSLHPYSFYGDITEWKSLDQVRDTIITRFKRLKIYNILLNNIPSKLLTYVE